MFRVSLLLVVLSAAQLPAQEKMHLILLVGQSNMAGRGVVAEQDKKPHDRVKMLNKANAWVPAVDPIHFDKSVAGVSLGRTFGILYAEANPGVTVGLIPCAVGGSPIDSWKPGALDLATKTHPWDDMLKRAKVAQEKGELKAILWHQGESDANAKLAPEYENKLHELVVRFRKELNAEKVPFVVGQLGKFSDVPWNEHRELVNKAHQDLPKHLPHCKFVSAEGLKHKGDKVHFDSESLRTFGKRYFEAYSELVK